LQAQKEYAEGRGDTQGRYHCGNRLFALMSEDHRRISLVKARTGKQKGQKWQKEQRIFDFFALFVFFASLYCVTAEPA
jgi:hypothetical protein